MEKLRPLASADGTGPGGQRQEINFTFTEQETESLSTEQLNGLVLALASEPRALLYQQMVINCDSFKNHFSRENLVNLLLEAQGYQPTRNQQASEPTDGWRIQGGNIESNLPVLINQGLVRELDGGYGLNGDLHKLEDRKNIFTAFALAGVLEGISQSLPLAGLVELFEASNKEGSKNRLAIMNAVVEAWSVRNTATNEVTIADITRIAASYVGKDMSKPEIRRAYNEIVSTHVRQLANLGLLEFRPAKKGEEIALYKFTTDHTKIAFEDLPPQLKKYVQVSKDLLQVLKEHPDEYLSGQDIYRFLAALPDSDYKNKDMPKFIHGILSNVLSAWTKGGLIVRRGPTGVSFASQDQARQLIQVVSVLNQFKRTTSSALRQVGLQIGMSASNDQVVARQLMGKARERSGISVEMQPEAVISTRNTLLEMILKNPGINMDDVVSKFTTAAISKRTIVNHLVYLLRDGRLYRTKEGVLYKWYLTMDDPRNIALFEANPDLRKYFLVTQPETASIVVDLPSTEEEQGIAQPLTDQALFEDMIPQGVEVSEETTEGTGEDRDKDLDELEKFYPGEDVLQEIRGYPRFSSADNIKYFTELAALEGDPTKGTPGWTAKKNELIDQIYKGNIGLVIREVIKHIGSGIPFDDLFQAGSVGHITQGTENYGGLMRAIQKYDVNRGSFSSYAQWWIRQGISRSVEGERLVHLPPAVIDDYRKIKIITAELEQETHDDVTIGQILERITTRYKTKPGIEWTEEYIQDILTSYRRARKILSIQQETTNQRGDEQPWEESLGKEDPGFEEVESPRSKSTDPSDLEGRLSTFFHSVSPRKDSGKMAQVVIALFIKNQTLEQAAKDLNITGERVRQIREEAMKILTGNQAATLIEDLRRKADQE